MTINKGNTIGIIALSGNVEPARIEHSRKYFESLGFNVILSKNIFEKDRYLAGSDIDKVEELHNFYKNPDIKLIMAARGGYGGIRLVNKIDYNLIKENPKPFCGFSDATALLLMIYKKCGIITYHSPMAAVDFGDTINSFTEQNFFDVINGNSMSYYGKKVYYEGSAEGVLWGGNLATIVSLCGTDFLPNKDFIFFTEDLNEPVYKIDRMFRQLINIEKFRKHCKGIALGEFLNSDNEEWLEMLFKEIAEELEIPFVSGFKITHGEEKITLPIGGKATITGKLLKV